MSKSPYVKGHTLLVGTRCSRLALTQCYQAITDIQDISKIDYRELIDANFNLIMTTGDEKQGTPEAGQLNKSSWVDNIESALTGGQINVAIHSGKDVPKDIAPGTKLLAVGQRNRPNDVFIGRKVEGRRLTFSDLPEDATIGTASLRRQLFLKRKHPNFKIKEHRGNIGTRIDKLDANPDLDGIILAAAGLRRMSVECDFEVLSHELMLPSASQGTLVAQIREDDSKTESIIRRVAHPETEISFAIERALSEELGADCKSCVGIYAFVENEQVNVAAIAIDPADSAQEVELSQSVPLSGYDHDSLLTTIKNDPNFSQLKALVAKR